MSLKPSQVNTIIKSSATQTAIAKVESGELAPIAQCLVNSNCAERLLRGKTVEEHEIGGLGLVLVARNTGYKRFVACSYLVDYWCLGLKDTIGEKKLNDIKYQQFLKMVYDRFSDGYEEISLDQAQAIVYGAIDYANKLGFKPHKDFQQTKNYLGTWCGEPKLTVLSSGQTLFYSSPHSAP